MYDLIENRPDGTVVVHIAFWRYIIFMFLFAFMFYVFFSASIDLYNKLPANFWQHLNGHTAITFLVFAGALATPVIAYRTLKGFYKKIQLEINQSSLRYLSGGVRGGILLSDRYATISYGDITGIEMTQGFLVNQIISVKTPSETHKIILILSEDEKVRCFEYIRKAVDQAKSRR